MGPNQTVTTAPRRLTDGATSSRPGANSDCHGHAAVRTVPLPQIVIDALKPRVAGRVSGEQAVTSPNGGFLRSNNWRRHVRWSRALQTTQLAPLTIHDLRHTYASLARASGADLRYVQKTMGHHANRHRQHLQRPLLR